MQQLTDSARQAVHNLSQRYAVSVDAVMTLLSAVARGGGTMAQFSHPELGGGGQWMQGGMTMVGDMFNGGLQSTVSGLCSELSNLLGSQQVYLPPPPPQNGIAPGPMAPGNSWWPAELGQPSTSGGQNDRRYAYFPHVRRLAVDAGGQVTIYDTLDNQISGVQQQQSGGPGSLEFSSQYGTFSVSSLPIVGPHPPAPSPPPAQAYQQPAPEPPPPAPPGGGPPLAQGDIFSAIEKLGQLHQQGVLTDSEFQAKKAELLSRL